MPFHPGFESDTFPESSPAMFSISSSRRMSQIEETRWRSFSLSNSTSSFPSPHCQVLRSHTHASSEEARRGFLTGARTKFLSQIKRSPAVLTPGPPIFFKSHWKTPLADMSKSVFETMGSAPHGLEDPDEASLS